MAKLNQINFGTSASTGTSGTKPNVGSALAKLLSTGLESKHKAKKLYESKSLDEDKLLYMDKKMKLGQSKLKNGFDTMSSEDRTEFLNEYESSSEFTFQNELYDKHFDSFMLGERESVSKLYNQEVHTNIKEKVIPNLGSMYASFETIEDVDLYADSLAKTGYKGAKKEILKSMVNAVGNELINNPALQNLSSKELKEKFPVLGLIQDKSITNTVDRRIAAMDKENTKKLYLKDINGYGSDMEMTASKRNNIAFGLAKKYNKTLLDVSDDLVGQQKGYVDMLANSGEPASVAQAVTVANANNQKITTVETFADNFLNMSTDVGYKGFQTYNLAKGNGYFLRSKNEDKIVMVTEVANTMGVKIQDAESWEQAVDLYKTKLENKNQIITDDELDKHSALNGWYDKMGTSPESMRFVRSQAKILSAFMSKDKAVEKAQEMSKSRIIGNGGMKGDWSSTQNVGSSKDVEQVETWFKTTYKNVEDLSMTSTENGFIISGTDLNGNQVDEVLTARQVDAIFKAQESHMIADEDVTKILKSEIDKAASTNDKSANYYAATNMLGDKIFASVNKDSKDYETKEEAMKAWNKTVDRDLNKYLSGLSKKEKTTIKLEIFRDVVPEELLMTP